MADAAPPENGATAVSAAGDRRLGAALGLIGAVLLALGGLVDLARGLWDLAVRHGLSTIPAVDEGIVAIVVALLVGVFAVLGGLRSEDRAMVAGVVLIVIAIVGWLALGFGSGLLAILATVFIVIAGVVFLASGR